MKGLTKRQEEYLFFILKEREEKGTFPTQAEMARHFSCSTKAVFDMVKALEDKGILECANGRIALSEKLRLCYDPKIIPLFDPYPERIVKNIAETDIGNGECFAMIVHAEDMKNAGILPSDIAVLEKAGKAENGSIILARCGDEILLRRYYKRSDGITELIPENDTMGKIVTAQAEVLAILVKSIRRYK